MREPIYRPSKDGTSPEQLTAINRTVAKTLGVAGIAVFPALITWNARSRKLDKKPAITRWRTNASIDPAQLERWWEEFSDAVAGIELGRAGLVVLDLDRHLGGSDGVAAFQRLRQGYDLPPRPATRTPSRGLHLYFRQPDGEPLGNSPGSLPGGIDVRGAGGWVVAPGSTTPWGKWCSAPKAPQLAVAFAGGTIPVLPEWLMETIGPATTITNTTITNNTVVTPSTNSNTRREEAWASVALEASVVTLAEMRPGGRNNTTNAIAYRLGRMAARGWIDASDIAQRLFDACVANGLVADDGALSVRKTVFSGIKAELAKPCPDIRDRKSAQP